jgi:hypothetical protein
VLDEGYEPPQGIVEIVSDDENVFADVLTNANGTQMNNRWTLEEDPNERKAGLWIWGLFSEPLYPYLLFSLDVNRVEVAPGGYHVPPGTLFAEMKHARGSKQGSVLTDGTLSFKVTKTYQADLVGLSEVAVGEPNKCGRIKGGMRRVARAKNKTTVKTSKERFFLSILGDVPFSRPVRGVRSRGFRVSWS